MMLTRFFGLKALSRAQQNPARFAASRRVLPYWLGTLGLAGTLSLSLGVNAAVQHGEAPGNWACWSDEWYNIHSDETCSGTNDDRGSANRYSYCDAHSESPSSVPPAHPSPGSRVDSLSYANDNEYLHNDKWCIVKDGSGLYWAFDNTNKTDAGIRPCYSSHDYPQVA